MMNIAKNKKGMMTINSDEYGTSYIFVNRKGSMIHIQLDSCETILIVKEAKELIAEIKNAIVRG